MKNRLKLIWLALTAPRAVLEDRTEQVEFAVDLAYYESTRKRLKAIKPHTWDLTGVRLEHSSRVDATAVQDFLADAPDIIKRLLDMAEPGYVEDMESALSAIGDILADMQTMPQYERDFAIKVQLPDLVGDYMPQVRKRWDDEIPF